jgi:hypothetical protein
MHVKQWFLKTLLILTILFMADTKPERSVVRSTFVATAGILATQMGMCAYYAKKGSLQNFILKNKSFLAVYVVAHYIVNYLFFSVLKAVKNENGFSS